jgi:hypothetical protein
LGVNGLEANLSSSKVQRQRHGQPGISEIQMS